MSWLEIAYVAAALVAAGMGGHAVGYAKAERIRKKQVMTALHTAWERGFETADRFFNDERYAHPGEDFENPYPLPNTNTKEKNQ